jgi:hypothetical protein
MKGKKNHLQFKYKESCFEGFSPSLQAGMVLSLFLPERVKNK